eukprot:Transcript_2866.p1 GENE.Transcript_2866~~Transcript_2866.p1  ORF type:complete len:198 (-),score=52.45 Transcript_2866:158-751(-)
MLLSLMIGSATAALDASALDSSSSALAGASSLVEIGAKGGGSDDGHDHDHGGGSGSDDDHQYWSTIPSSPTGYEVMIGDRLSFKYSVYHNVYLMPSQEAYASCNFSEATELASATYGGGEGSFPNVYEAVTTSMGTLYFACEVGAHCKAGQKIEVTVTAAPPPAAPPEEDSPAPRLAPGRLGVLLLVAAASLLSISL